MKLAPVWAIVNYMALINIKDQSHLTSRMFRKKSVTHRKSTVATWKAHQTWNLTKVQWKVWKIRQQMWHRQVLIVRCADVLNLFASTNQRNGILNFRGHQHSLVPETLQKSCVAREGVTWNRLQVITQSIFNVLSVEPWLLQLIATELLYVDRRAIIQPWLKIQRLIMRVPTRLILMKVLILCLKIPSTKQLFSLHLNKFTASLIQAHQNHLNWHLSHANLGVLCVTLLPMTQNVLNRRNYEGWWLN